MRYANYDHAAWVERNIAAHKRNSPKKKPRKDAYGVPVGLAAGPEKLNDAQARAINILGIVGGGIYNAPITWDSVGWLEDGIKVSWNRLLSTFDGGSLTLLVFLCHAGRMRGAIVPSAPGTFTITLTQRADECDENYARHPSLAEAVAAFDVGLPATHPIRFEAVPVEKAA